MLQNASNDRYLDADGRHSGFNVDTNRRALPDTIWDLIDNGDGTWSLLNLDEGRYLDADGAGNNWNVNQSRVQRDDDLWEFIAQEDGSYLIRNVQFGRYLNQEPNGNVNTTDTPTRASRWDVG